VYGRLGGKTDTDLFAFHIANQMEVLADHDVLECLPVLINHGRNSRLARKSPPVLSLAEHKPVPHVVGPDAVLNLFMPGKHQRCNGNR
jgi:hypothetical protein